MDTYYEFAGERFTREALVPNQLTSTASEVNVTVTTNGVDAAITR